MSLPGKWRAAPVVKDMARSAHIGHMARSAYVETHGAGATATTGVRGRQASRRRFVARAAAEQSKKAGDSWTKCDVYGDVTLCNECWRVIQPIWVLSADEKKKLFKRKAARSGRSSS